ncbi:MAG: hypothetical protein RLZZ28_767 [Bacteroidota bacterium]|jgi:type IX secretion system PorP/SprF family membrane protein
MRKHIKILFGILIFLSVKTDAQIDAHFTQYYAYPLWLNPAFTGAMDGGFRITGNYRQQWPETLSALVSQALSADFSLPANFAIGATIINQQTSGGAYKYSSGYLSLSYQAHLSEHQILCTGFQLGLLNRKIDIGQFQFGNQFNPVVGFDPSMPANESFSKSAATSLDGSVGLLYFDGDPSKKANLYIGTSLFHPTQPDNHFLSDNTPQLIPMRFSFHAGVRLKINERIDLIPHAVYQLQGTAHETTAGLSVNLKMDDDKSLIGGTVYRVGDALSPNLGLYFNGITIGFSYDITMSQLKTVSSANGGYELSVSFTNPKKIATTKPVCPRL